MNIIQTIWESKHTPGWFYPLWCHLCQPALKTLYRWLKENKIPLCQGMHGPCFRLGKRRRQHTFYVEDELNWVFMCDDCFEENEEYWNERWNEYYSECM